MAELPTFEFDDFDDEPYCYRCDGSGWIITCCDDICVGSGECIHGDGEQLCPDCGGRNAI